MVKESSDPKQSVNAQAESKKYILFRNAFEFIHNFPSLACYVIGIH